MMTLSIYLKMTQYVSQLPVLLGNKIDNLVTLLSRIFTDRSFSRRRQYALYSDHCKPVIEKISVHAYPATEGVIFCA